METGDGSFSSVFIFDFFRKPGSFGWESMFTGEEQEPKVRYSNCFLFPYLISKMLQLNM